MSTPASGTTSSPAGMPSLANTFGVLLVSIFVSLMMYGITLAQTIRYARLYSSDRPFLKILVAAIFIADTLHSASMMHICYHYLVTNYLNPSALSVNVWTLDLLPLSTGITVLLTQGFYTRRIYIVSYKYRRIVIFIVFLLFVELGFMTGSSVMRHVSSRFSYTLEFVVLIFSPLLAVSSFRNGSFDGMQRYIWMDTVLFGTATVVDLVLTGAFVTIMRRSRTGILGPYSALDILSRYALYATGLISALTVPAFICSVVLSRTFVFFAIAIPAVKVYSNSVLAVLNCRKSLPHPGDTTGGSKSRHVELTIVHPGRYADESRHSRRATIGQGTEVPHIVVDICAASEEDPKRFRRPEGDSESECLEPKYTTRIEDAESIA